jgi:hypothetical protein
MSTTELHEVVVRAIDTSRRGRGPRPCRAHAGKAGQRSISFWCACALTAGSALWAPNAHAAGAPEPLRLEWDSKDASPSCPTEQTLRRALRQRLEADAFSATAARVLSVGIVSRGATHEATLSLRDGSGGLLGTRTVRDNTATCQQLLPALALIIGLLAHGDTPWVEPEPATEPFRPPEPRPVRQPTPTEPEPHGWIGLGTGIAVRTLPEPARIVTVQAGGSLTGPLEIEIGAARLSPETRELGRMRFEVGATELWLAPVYGLRAASWLMLRLEAGLAYGWLQCGAQNALPRNTGELWFSSIRLGSALELGITSNLGLRLGVRAETPFARQRLRVAGLPRPVFTQPWFGGRAELLGTWQFR